jgi:hypothetical protein
VNERRLIAAWSAAGQEQLFRHWGSRPPEARRRLLDDLQALDPSLVKELAGALGRRRAQAGLPR